MKSRTEFFRDKPLTYSHQQKYVIDLINNGYTTARMLADYLERSMQTVYVILNKLERFGFIILKKDPISKKIEIEIDERGMRVVNGEKPKSIRGYVLNEDGGFTNLKPIKLTSNTRTPEEH